MELPMLIQHDQIAIRVGKDGASRAACALVGFCLQHDALCLQGFLNVAHVLEGVNVASSTIPAWIEGHDILVEHSFKQANCRCCILHDDPVGAIAVDHAESELLIEHARFDKILYDQADRKVSEFHVRTPERDSIQCDRKIVMSREREVKHGAD